MNKQDLEQFKKKLLAEQAELVEEISGIGSKDKQSPGGWDATSGGIEVDPADENEVADKLEEIDGNNAILAKLEVQLTDVKDALARIQKGTYGICEKCDKPIEKERLEANPSARVSLKHKH